MRYVSYTRTTTCLEFEEIIENAIGIQNKHINEYAKEHNFKIDEKYSDRKKSHSENEGFKRLLEDGMSRRFDILVVDSLLRCGATFAEGREVIEQTFYYAGINFIVVEDDFDSRDKKPEEVKQYFKAKDKYVINKMLHHNENNWARAGHFNPMMVPYGYKLDQNRKLIIDKEYDTTIELIFNEFIEGKKPDEIAEMLSSNEFLIPSYARKLNLKSKKSNPYGWDTKMIKEILKNESYIGKYSRKINGENTIISIPQIIDESIFNKAQELLSQIPKRPKSKHVVCKFRDLPFDNESGEWFKFRKKDRNDIEGAFVLVESDQSYPYKQWITKEDLETMVDIEMTKEKALAYKIKALIELGEGQAFLMEKRKIYSDRLNSYFNKVAEEEVKTLEIDELYKKKLIDKDTYRNRKEYLAEKLIDAEAEFKSITNAVDFLEEEFSYKNKWIKEMTAWKDAKSATRAELLRYIDRIIVEDYKVKKIITKFDKWKKDFPEEWTVNSNG